MNKTDVKVEVLNMIKANSLEEMINYYLNEGYMIQDSQVEWYQGTIMGVYIFIKS